MVIYFLSKVVWSGIEYPLPPLKQSRKRPRRSVKKPCALEETDQPNLFASEGGKNTMFRAPMICTYTQKRHV